MPHLSFHVYMLTNAERTVLYTGVTNNLPVRLTEHWMNVNANSFTARNKAYYLVWYEQASYAADAIAREKELSAQSLAQKQAVVAAFNPGWEVLNTNILGSWPPTEAHRAAVTARRAGIAGMPYKH